MKFRSVFLCGLLVMAPGPAASTTGVSYARVHHPVSTASLAAAASFDRGLTLLYAFNRFAARRAFYGAAAADPHLAMAYWGVAMSYGANINFSQDAPGERAGYAALQRALALGGSASAVEREYIKALAVRFTSDPKPNYAALANAYHDAMRALAQKYPDDPDAVTLYAESAMDLRPWDLYAPDGTPRPGTVEICATLESVLRRVPGHIGANHFYVHATEASTHPERALQAAGRLASLNLEPAASHLTHMPAHTLARTGFYAAATGADILATEHDRAYLSSDGRRDGEAVLYYAHDLTFLAYTDGMDGDRSGALGTIAPLSASGARVPGTFALVRFGRWHDILALPPAKADPNEPLRSVFWRFARGMALADTGDLAAAARERHAMHVAGDGLHLPAVAGYTNASDALVALADDVLGAKIARARRDGDAEIRSLRAAVRAQDRLIYIEPPDWDYPVRESLGGALLRAGRPSEAARVFRDDLARNPRNPRSLFGLTEALAATSDTTGAERARTQFQDAWKGTAGELTAQSL